MDKTYNMKTLLDGVARERALDITQSYHVEAPAGSGKTTLLVARFIRLLRHVRHPSEILALTFTNKAAGEMKNRIVKILRMAIEGKRPHDPLEAQLLPDAKKALELHKGHEFLLLSPEGLQIMTFHGFCYSLIKRAPLEAGVSHSVSVLEEERQRLLLKESIRNTISKILSLSEDAPERIAFENRLLRLNNRLSLLIKEMMDLVMRRDLLIELVETFYIHPGIDALEEALTRSMESLVDEVLEDAATGFIDTQLARTWPQFYQDLSNKGAPNAKVLPDHIPDPEWRNLPMWKEIALVLTTKDGRPRKVLGPNNGGFYQGFGKTPWGELVRELPIEVTHALNELKGLPDPGQPPTDMEALYDLIILISKAIADYEERCKRLKVLDFVGLEQAALKVMHEDHPTDLQLFLDYRIHHILVDEFQDTSLSQWKLIQRLCMEWATETGRTLFLVGDPKQSIYAFRKAEVRLFFEAKKGVPVSGHGLLPLEPLTLSCNFRSAGPLVEWTNQVFGHTVMAKSGTTYDEVPFSPSTTCQDNDTADNRSNCIFLNIFLETESINLAQVAEATWLAQSIKRVLPETPSHTTIGILLFNRNRLSVYLDALNKTGIPVNVKEGLKLIEQPEVVHLYQIATALCRPHDDLAWASLLRSPWAWVGTDILLRISRLPPSSWPEKFKVAARTEPEIKRVLDAMALGRRRVGRDPLSHVVNQVWQALDGPRCVASRAGTVGVANCRRFLEILESVEEGIPEDTMERLDSVLETSYVPESPDAARSRVQLMTIHGAKGLEFDIVFLPFLDWSPLSHVETPPYLMEKPTQQNGVPLIAMGPDRRLSAPEPVYLLLKRRREKRILGESKRLFYVGVTRARKQLFLSGIARHDKGRINAPRNTPLSWIMEHHGLEGKLLTQVSSYQNKSVHITVNPLTDPLDQEGSRSIKPCPPPIRFQPQPIPYRLKTPTEITKSLIYDDDPGETLNQGPSDTGAISGIIIHRLIETLWLKQRLPKISSIENALICEGMEPDEAKGLAPTIAKDLEACLKDPFFRWLLDRSDPDCQSEFYLEAVCGKDMIQAGRIDLLKISNNRFWIVDFKTSRPEPNQPTTDFMREQAKTYRPQLMAYREMLARLHAINPDQIVTGIYFTALQKWYEILPNRD